METVSLYSEQGPLNKSREGQEPAVSCPPESRQLSPKSRRHLCRQGRVGVMRPPRVGAGAASPSVHLRLLAVRQLAPWPRLQGQRGCLLLLHRLTAVGTVFLQLCKASPRCCQPWGFRGGAAGTLPSPTFPVPVLCSFSSASVLWSILTALRSPMESSASSSPPRLPPASCGERALSGAGGRTGRGDGGTPAGH